MNLGDAPQPTMAERINAAFEAILRGRYDAPEVLDVLWGRVGDRDTYWQVRNERGWRMQIDHDCERAQDEIRVGAAAIRASLNRRFDAIAAQVAR